LSDWTDEIIYRLLELRKENCPYSEISEILEEEFGIKKTSETLRKAHTRYRDIGHNSDDYITNLKTKRSAQKTSSRNAKEVRTVLDHLAAQDAFLDQFKDVLSTTKFKIHPVVKKKTKKKAKRTIVAHISDTHFGANIDGEEMGGLNKYSNIEEARRLAFYTREVAGYKMEHRKNTDLVIALNADLIQGVIHDIDSTTPLTTQFSTALCLLSQSISYLANEFNNVKVICTTGNHGRAMHRPDKKRPTKNRWDAYSTMLNVALEHALKDFKNVSFDIPATPYWYGKIQGHNYFILHSDAVLSTGSVGKNVSVESIKNKINDLISGIGPIDVVLAGHTHVPLSTILNNGVRLLCNGNLSGVDEFCLSLGIVTNHPSQQLFEVTEKYALGDLRNVMVLEADGMKELDKIIAPFKGKF